MLSINSQTNSQKHFCGECLHLRIHSDTKTIKKYITEATIKALTNSLISLKHNLIASKVLLKP